MVSNFLLSDIPNTANYIGFLSGPFFIYLASFKSSLSILVGIPLMFFSFELKSALR